MLTAENRRKKIVTTLKKSAQPVSASSLAEQLQVSRQVIVGDVALLRAAGLKVSATPRGYVLEKNHSMSGFEYIGIIACKHDNSKLADELYTVVDFGGTVIDVTIEHLVYGQLSGPLNISSRYDVDLFVGKVMAQKAQPLSKLTGGIHIHTIGCKDKETFERIKASLMQQGIAMS